ncbi:MAG: hypothetical protein WAR79_07145 [Melioribacteraceae bacterium]
MGRPRLIEADPHSNVVTMEAHREVEDKARRHLSKNKVFAKNREPAIDINTLRKGDILMVESQANRSLQLAQEYDFLEMCLPILWGDERLVHFERFGWLLRGAVITFRPLTVFELYLIKNIVAAQWRLDRLYQTQTNVYENEARSGVVGKYGLPQASHSAMELDEKLYAAQKALSAAIKNHLMTVQSVIKANKR